MKADSVSIALIKQDLKSLKSMFKKAVKTGNLQMGLTATDLQSRINETKMLLV
jgi:hypothetical protein